MNDGKSMSDLMEVVDDWNEGADENGLDACTAWVLNPIFKANADFARETGWLGYAPIFTEMGEGMHAWITRGQKINERFKQVWTCAWQSEAATMLVRPPTEDPSSAAFSFSDCTHTEGVTPPDLMATTARWNACLDEQEVLAAIGYHFPGHGNSTDMTAEMKISVWRPSLATYGRDVDLSANGGGRQMDKATFGEIMSCDSPRMYAATVVRTRQAQ